jgi:hypothetical protein
VATTTEDRLSFRRRNPHTLLPAVAEQSAPALLVACCSTAGGLGTAPARIWRIDLMVWQTESL